jgi:carbamoyl-phosphate synthase small subunit
MKGAITTGDPEEALEIVHKMDSPDRKNLVSLVSTRSVQSFESGKERSVVVIDCGVKDNIINELKTRFDVHVVPYNHSAEAIRALEPDGVFITNGPGDPAHEELESTVVAALAALKDELPMMGICLGNQLLAITLGARTYKLKFGHRGVNQPVGFDKRVFVTSQNHGFAVDGPSASDVGMDVTFKNLNDGTVEGMRHSELPIFSVQFHPEARPGPHDTTFLFDEFVKMLEEV